MVHLPALPGAPGWGGDWSVVERRALADAEALAAGGAGAIMVENYHDVPFYPGAVPPLTIAAMARIVSAIRSTLPATPLGVNVLRNDAQAALAIALACGASFVRVNVHCGSAVTDQGVIDGRAHETLRLRRALDADVGILADVRVKHARPLAERPLAEEAADLRLRGLADAVILTGAATGSAGDPEELRAVRDALPDCPLLVGSGVNEANLADFSAAADGFIVGTFFKQPGAEGAVSAERVRRMIAAWRTLNSDRKSASEERKRS